jgi:hypothetical protein
MIALGSVLAPAFMMHHPSPRSHTMADFIEAVRQGALTNAVVHGALVTVIGLLVVGFSFLAERLGRDSFVARAGLVAYGVGAIALIAAALVSGFILPEFVSRYQGRPQEEVEVVRHVLGLCRAVNQVCSRVGVMGTAVAVLLWSMLLVRRTGLAFAVGVLGCVAGTGLAIGLLSGYLKMDVHGVLVFILAQSVWSMGVAVLLIRRR